MFPVLVAMYVRLAQGEARDVEATFGEAYRRYRAVTPAPRRDRPARAG